MKKLTWFHELGFYNNPFSIKPAAFHNELMGYEKLVEEINDKVNNYSMLLIYGEYGTGKTTILKEVINEFRGQRKVIYYNCNQDETTIDFDKLLINAGGFFSRLFRIRKNNMIMMLDEAQDMNKKDIKKSKEYFDEGYFKSVVFVSKIEDLKHIKEIEELVGDNKFKLGEISKTDAIRLVRKRIGDMEFLQDKIITKIFTKNKNPRNFLKNCEEVCRHAFEEGSTEVTDEHVKILNKK
jgi:AAA+ ATPase superfamily predicted ATPase